MGTNRLMKRQRPVKTRDAISPDLLPIFSMKTYTRVFIGTSITAKTNCVRYMFSPNPVIFKVIP